LKKESNFKILKECLKLLRELRV